METIHRILSGSPLSSGELRFAGIFVLFWFCADMFFSLYSFLVPALAVCIK